MKSRLFSELSYYFLVSLASLPASGIGAALLTLELGVLLELPEPVDELESEDGLGLLEEPALELGSAPGAALGEDGVPGVGALGELPKSLLDAPGIEDDPLGAEVSGSGDDPGPSFLLLSQADNPRPSASDSTVGTKILLDKLAMFISDSLN